MSTIFTSRTRATRRSDTFVWLIPILAASVVFLAINLKPKAFMKDGVFFPLLIIYGLIAPVGGIWAIYQCIRYEKHPWKQVVIVIFVPFGFVWYYFQRYRVRVDGKAQNGGEPRANG